MTKPKGLGGGHFHINLLSHVHYDFFRIFSVILSSTANKTYNFTFPYTFASISKRAVPFTAALWEIASIVSAKASLTNSNKCLGCSTIQQFRPESFLDIQSLSLNPAPVLHPQNADTL
jgi:hypothetical protein